MEISSFIAKFWGLYLLIMAALMLVRKEQVSAVIRECILSKPFLVFSGIISLFFGLAIVLIHPVWEMNWRIAITLLGYLALVVGIVRIGFTGFVQKRALVILQKGYWTLFFVSLLLGAYLTYHGFMPEVAL